MAEVRSFFSTKPKQTAQTTTMEVWITEGTACIHLDKGVPFYVTVASPFLVEVPVENLRTIDSDE